MKRNDGRTLKTWLAEKIREQIARGEYLPGEHLRLQELADRFEVSTMPVREALRLLEREGIVISQEHRGTFVTSFTPDELVDIFEIRASMEQMATVHAVPLLTDATLRYLHELVSKWTQPADGFEILRYNLTFHTTLYDTCRREFLCKTIKAWRRRTEHYLRIFTTGEIDYDLDQSHRDHLEVLRACQEGRSVDAGEIIFQHIQRAGAILADYVRQRGIYYS